MIPKFRVYLKIHKKIVDVREINYKYKEIVWANRMYTEVDNFEDVELLQSTGLKDKNGVGIFEGDIVKLEKGLGILREIIFKDCEFKMRTSHSEKPLNSTRKDGLIIVGNKYEHPYLLKE
ncbi:YopX family protein [Staphylococcus xylosus]|uniref:YopX family protein n=1 Tax=Staphylococcus xylosus TaxID=1288 RepID=UPI003F98EDFE